MSDAKVNSLQPGCIVRLRTGGPQMTINRRVDGLSSLLVFECVWFNGPRSSETLQRESFSESALIEMEAPK